VPIFTNAVDWSTGTLEFPNEDRCCACSSCGTCKQAPIKDAKRRGLTTVMVGDGISDRKAALLVDVLFAKDGLARWCDRSGVPHHPFATLAEVRAVLLPDR
jgi:2-hydroxy-3-keto-5-methylthiopentenyl-1-phosphate phosphatase